MDKNIILIGAFNETIELIEDNGFKIIGFFDNLISEDFYGYKNFGPDQQAEKLYPEHKSTPVVIAPDQPAVREKLFNYYTNLGYKVASIISNKAQISRTASIGNGCIIQSLVNISSECNIGQFVKINTLANVMHNAVVGDYTTIAPNAVLLGNVKIGKSCYIGSNATILPNIEICDEVVIGAGSVVTKNIDSKGVYAGNPAKLLKK